MSLVAFLGRYVGQFTVSLDSGDVALALATKSDFSDATTYLRIDSLPSFEEWSYSYLPMDDYANFTSSKLDSESTDYLTGANYNIDTQEVDSLNYFKYTFYLRNTGNYAADYTFRLNFTDHKLSSSGDSILDSMRIMLFASDVTEDSSSASTTSGTVYAHKSKTTKTIVDSSTNETITTDQEYISITPEEATETSPCYGLATNFASDDMAFDLMVNEFEKGQTMRYTIVTWLEGFDPEVDGISASRLADASVKMGVSIDATQSQQIQ